MRWTKTYELLDGRGKPVDLKDLFGTHDRLILVYNMGRQCPWCTTWADGFSDNYHRIAEKMAFVVVSSETPEIQQQNRKERDWHFPMVSAKNSPILQDLGFVKGDTLHPGFVFFSKDDANHLYFHDRYTFGPGDHFGMLWHLLDLVGKWDRADYAPPVAK